MAKRVIHLQTQIIVVLGVVGEDDEAQQALIKLPAEGQPPIRLSRDSWLAMYDLVTRERDALQARLDAEDPPPPKGPTSPKRE